MHWLLFAIFSVFIILFIVTGEVITHIMLRKLSSHTCTGRLWRRGFPSASKHEIRQFLDTVLLAFALNDHRRLTLAPAVKVMDLYRAVEPPFFNAGVDAMEIENLFEEIENRFGIDLIDHWHEQITLGEMFALAQTGKT